jgi:phospholipase D1/2
MRPAPVPNQDETYIDEDASVADPLSDELLKLLDTTARVNREVFTELFRPIPSNLVHNWKAYEVSGQVCTFARALRLVTQFVKVYKPKGRWGHVVPGVPLYRVKERLALVRGSIVEAPLVSCLCCRYWLGSGFNFENHRTF